MLHLNLSCAARKGSVMKTTSQIAPNLLLRLCYKNTIICKALFLICSHILLIFYLLTHVTNTTTKLNSFHLLFKINYIALLHYKHLHLFVIFTSFLLCWWYEHWLHLSKCLNDLKSRKRSRYDKHSVDRMLIMVSF